MRRVKHATKTLAGAIVLAQFALVGTVAAAGHRNADLTVYVESQGLFYDSILAAKALPPKGRFQKLNPVAGPGGVPSTEYGPGDHGYVGGRWWVDANGNDEMDGGDVYFSCPLLGPGRIDP